ncbi:MAG: sigma-70 family RNA polymerase sigma factor [Polyangiaceae bacterium]|nr:sigma-70 family RNA polymerase sigma factor [Myxococcales bacterium]MCB9587627.1 sigma-70 family RNA polymerase sigma factor [Polyangiaceae bacterium]MCB9605576.1 sigma-70 family RNA polymerase sigma factor [Polyangiaceae bacterium]
MTTQSDPQLDRFIRSAYAAPRLDRAQEAALFAQWRAHDDQSALDELLAAHLRYVVAIALKYRRYGVPLSELVAEGNLGLVHATHKFSTEHGTRLITYASHWIRAFMLNHVTRNWSIVRSGNGALNTKLFFKLRRERAKLVALLGDGDAVDVALAARLQMDPTLVQTMLGQLLQRDVSLDAPLFAEEDATRLDGLASPDASAEGQLMSYQTGALQREVVHEALGCLDPRERLVVEERLMASPEDELSLADLARHFGVSRERARQLEARAKIKLRTRIETLMRERAALDWPLAQAA